MYSLMYIKRNSLSCMQLFNLSPGEGGVQWNEGMCLTPHPFTYIMTVYDFHFTVFDQSLLLLLMLSYAHYTSYNNHVNSCD